MAAPHFVAGGVPSAAGCEVPGGRTAERLHEAAESTDEGIHGVDVMAARDTFRVPSCVECEVRDAFVFRDPFAGRMTVRAKHCVRCHYRQQRARDRRLTRIRDGLESAMPDAVCCREEFSFPGAPAAPRRCRRRAATPVIPPAQAQWRGMVFSGRAGAGPIPASLCGSRAGGPRRPPRCRQVQPGAPAAGRR